MPSKPAPTIVHTKQTPRRSESLGVKRLRQGLDGKPVRDSLLLRSKKVSQLTLNRYQRSIAAFKTWAHAKRKPISKKHLDNTVNLYITQLYKADFELSSATYLVYGLQLLECVISKQDFLTISKQSLAGWRKEAPWRDEETRSGRIHLGCGHLSCGGKTTGHSGCPFDTV